MLLIWKFHTNKEVRIKYLPTRKLPAFDRLRIIKNTINAGSIIPEVDVFMAYVNFIWRMRFFQINQ